MSVAERQNEWVEDFLFLPDVHARLEALMTRALLHDEIAENERLDQHRVEGCVSAVWIKGQYRDGKCFFQSAADSAMVRALVAWLCDLYQDATPEDVYQTEPEIWEKLGFERQLSPTRLNGLKAVRGAIKDFAKQQMA